MKVLAFLCGLWMVAAVNAAQPPDLAFEARLKNLETGLRCLVCQNQTLADSNASLADDLRREVRELALSGKSDDEIKSYLVARYGDFVLYKPPLQTNTVLLWLLPFALLLGGAGLWWALLRQRRLRPAAGFEVVDGEPTNAGAASESEEAAKSRARGRRLLQGDGESLQAGGPDFERTAVDAGLAEAGADRADARAGHESAGVDAADVGTMVPAAGAAAELLAASDHDAASAAAASVSLEAGSSLRNAPGSRTSASTKPRPQHKRKKNPR